MFANLSKFRIILNAVQASTLGSAEIKQLLSLAGVQIDDALVPLIVQVLKSRGSGKSLFDLIGDKELMDEVEALLNMQSNKALQNTDSGHLVSTSTVIRCPHCALAFSIATAPGMEERIANKG